MVEIVEMEEMMEVEEVEEMVEVDADILSGYMTVVGGWEALTD